MTSIIRIIQEEILNTIIVEVNCNTLNDLISIALIFYDNFVMINNDSFFLHFFLLPLVATA